MAIIETGIKNQNVLHFVKKAHGLMDAGDIEKTRQSQEHIASLFKSSKDLLIEGFEIGHIHVEKISVDRPHYKKTIILHCHGGGYATGSTGYARSLTTRFAEMSGLEVYSFDYRLAPEHPYPAATEDAMTVWNYLMMQGYGAKDIILTGDSAGGNLALSLTMQLKEDGRFLPRALILLSPWTDLTAMGESYAGKAEVDPVLTKEYIDKMTEAYALGQDLTDWHISPLYGNFKDFPPTYIQVGGNEILYSDSARLYKAMKVAGVPVTIDVFNGMWHVFQMVPIKPSKDAWTRITEYICTI